MSHKYRSFVLSFQVPNFKLCPIENKTLARLYFFHLKKNKTMKNKKIDRIKIMFGKYKSLEAEGLPESSLVYLLLTLLIVMATSLFTWFYR
jgi:hypothetical protein